MRYVIIGNSAAAVGCIEGIRLHDQQGEITVISGEKHHVYGRPMISYLLLGKTDPERMMYRPFDFYEKQGVRTMFGRTAVKLDAKGKTVSLDDGTEVPYDKVLMATGSRPFVPPFAGLDTVEKKFSFMTLDDALGLQEALFPQARVLVIGAGLIGLKCAEAVSEKAGRLVVVDMMDHLMPTVLDIPAAKRVQDHLEQQGMEFRLSDTVEKFEHNTAKLKSGETVEFDILVLAVGVRPNTQLVSDAGGKVDRGIVVNDRGQTDLADVYAAGDCTQGMDAVGGTSRILALWPNAVRQGLCAGENMAGFKTSVVDHIALNATGLCGLHMVSAGNAEGEMDVVSDGETYKVLYIGDNRLNGYTIMGDCTRAGIYTALVRSRTKLDSIDFALIREKPQLMAFSKAERKIQLGGAKA
jgi:NAD(P)H-nitrite reductase large subunit